MGSCGGGTDGTGGGDGNFVTVRGTVQDASGAPVPDAKVKIIGKDTATQSDQSGNFELTTEASAQEGIQLEITGLRVTGTASIRGLPQGTGITVELKVSIDSATGSISIEQNVIVDGDIIVTDGGSVEIGVVNIQ